MIIILQHGLFGFASRKVGPVNVEYFAGIADALRAAGHTPIATGVNPIGGVVQRAEQLRQQIMKRIPDSRAGEKILIIGHSMGGLDAREMLARVGVDLAPRVAAVVTVATPHHGSPIADLVMLLKQKLSVSNLFERFSGLRRAFEKLFPSEPGAGTFVPWLGINQDAIPNLTTQFCTEFNETTRNAPGVRHFWIAANCTGKVPFFFTKSYEIVLETDRPAGGENDGVVSVGSAEPPLDHDNPWIGLGTWPVDHLNAVNMRLPLDPLRPDVTPRYLDLLRQLNEAGVETPPDAR